MFRRFFVFLILVLFLVPQETLAVSKTLVINSFQVAGQKSTDEFIEIRNISANTININGWQLAKQTASGTKYNLITSFQSMEIPTGESIVIGHKDSSISYDLPYSTGYSLAEDNTIVLFSDVGKTMVDKVGYGKAPDFEGAALPTAGTDTWDRTEGIDTDNNGRDFQKEGTINGEVKDYSGICLTEIMPDPGTGADEWIELYNSESTKDISGLSISDKLGSTKKYTVPAGTIVEEGKYFVFYGKDTGLALNNDGDGVVLIDFDGSILDDTGESYGTTKAGFSYAYDGEKWQWSKTPTPGALNIITLEQENIASLKAKKTTAIKPKAIKGKAPKVEVLGETAEDSNLFSQNGAELSASDRILGYILIGVALLAGLAYTIFINREKLGEVFKQERKGYYKAWRNFWKKVHRRRDLLAIRRVGWWKDTIHKRFSRRPWD